MIFFDSASPMPGSCLRSSSLALLRSSCFFIGLPAPPLASGLSLLAGGLVVVPAASAIGTDAAPSANSNATSIAMSLVMETSSERSVGLDRSRRPGESRSTFGAGPRGRRVPEAPERGLHGGLAGAAGDLQRDLRARRRAGHPARQVVRALDRLTLEGAGHEGHDHEQRSRATHQAARRRPPSATCCICSPSCSSRSR